MDIKTKFDINDEVWFVHPNTQRAVQGRIKEINIKIGGKPKYRCVTDGKKSMIRTGEYETQLFVHKYLIDDNVRKEGVSKSGYDIHKTKEELTESLFPEEIKNEFEKRREDMVCNYSGLPSVNSY